MAIKRPIEEPFIAMPKTKKAKLTDDEKRARQREYSRRHREKAKASTTLPRNRAAPLATSKRVPLVERHANNQQVKDREPQHIRKNFPHIQKWLDESSSEEDLDGLDAEVERVAKFMMSSDDEEEEPGKKETKEEEEEEERVAKIMLASDDEEEEKHEPKEEEGDISDIGLADRRLMLSGRAKCHSDGEDAHNESDNDSDNESDEESDGNHVLEYELIRASDTEDTEDDDESKSDRSCATDTERDASYREYYNVRYKIYDNEDRDAFFRNIHRLAHRKRNPALAYVYRFEENEEHAEVAAQRLSCKYPELVSGLSVLQLVEVLNSFKHLRGMAFRV